MRLDKFLKVSRIIKRRTVANDACDAEHVMVNGRRAKASYDVKEGDVIEITFGQRTLKARVLNVKNILPKRTHQAFTRSSNKDRQGLNIVATSRINCSKSEWRLLR